MTIYKKATCPSKVIIASSVYCCEECGQTEVVVGSTEEKQCPECQGKMSMISSHLEEDAEIV